MCCGLVLFSLVWFVGVFLPPLLMVTIEKKLSLFSWLKLKFYLRKFNLKFLTHIVGNYSLITYFPLNNIISNNKG